MSSEHTDTTRRKLLKGIGVTGLAFGTMGVAGATEDDAPKSDEITTDGSWEYKCTNYPCSSGDYAQQLKRYCANGDCSGWETDGCCL